ncbi:MAG: LysM peptidoglycan-binding domain-containing protein [Defluviitaleaceae bacterium]|nr:LysM peptidoglycan-binding domain-containing protein [Defluviitaleaceae bacterium]
MLDEFFPGMEIVGWMQSQPSYGVYLNQHYAAYHLRQFKKPYHVLFVVDPLERANGFYMANQAALTPADRLAEVSGYFIYYEKNTNMHEYMLANKSLDYTAADPNYIEVTPMEYTAEGDYDSYHEPDYGFEKNEGRFTMMGREPEDVIRRHQANKAKRKGQVSAQKRATNLLGSLSAVLFVVAFVMGVSLIRNQERIERMELEIRQLITAHRNLSQHVASGELAPVFAEVAQQEYPTYIYDTNADTPTPETAIETAILPTAPDEQEAIIPPTPEAYTIQPGDSLIAISIRFFGDAGMVEEILALNGIEDPDLIVAGRTIALPQR